MKEKRSQKQRRHPHPPTPNPRKKTTPKPTHTHTHTHTHTQTHTHTHTHRHTDTHTHTQEKKKRKKHNNKKTKQDSSKPNQRNGSMLDVFGVALARNVWGLTCVPACMRTAGLPVAQRYTIIIASFSSLHKSSVIFAWGAVKGYTDSLLGE